MNITYKVKSNNWFKTQNFRFHLTWTNETSPAARRLSAERSIHPLLDSSEFSISRNLTIAQLAASVDWLDARRRISDTIRRDTCWQNARMSRNFSIISDDGLFPNTCKAIQLHDVFYFILCHIILLVPYLCDIFLQEQQTGNNQRGKCWLILKLEHVLYINPFGWKWRLLMFAFIVELSANISLSRWLFQLQVSFILLSPSSGPLDRIYKQGTPTSS